MNGVSESIFSREQMTKLIITRVCVNLICRNDHSGIESLMSYEAQSLSLITHDAFML